MPRKYSQLSIEERLERAPSTISRERNRNRRQGAYRATVAHQKMVKRRRQPSFKLLTNAPLWLLIQQLIRHGWSPQQISGRLRAHYPDKAGNRVSHETIYRTIYAFTPGRLAPGND